MYKFATTAATWRGGAGKDDSYNAGCKNATEADRRETLYEFGPAPQRNVVPREEDEPRARKEHDLRKRKHTHQHRTSPQHTTTTAPDAPQKR